MPSNATTTMLWLCLTLWASAAFSQDQPAPPPAPEPAPADTTQPAPSAEAPLSPAEQPKPAQPTPESTPTPAPDQLDAPRPATDIEPEPADEPVMQFQFDGMPYEDVIRRFAQFAGKPIFGAIDIGGELTFFDSYPYTYREALDLLNLMLEMQGYMLVEDGRFLRLVPLADPGQLKVRILKGTGELDALPPSELVTVMLPVQHIDVDSAAKALVPMVSIAGKIAKLDRGKGVLITDRVGSIQRIRELLTLMDQAAQDTTNLQMKSVALKHATAEDAARMVTTLLAGGRGERSRQPGTVESVILAVPEARSNTLMLRGTPDMMLLADQIVTMIDDPNAVNSDNLRVFGLKTAGARDVAEALRTMVGRENRNVLIYGDGSMNAVLVRANFQEMRQIEQMIEKLDSNVTEFNSIRAFTLRTTAAKSVVELLQSVLTPRDARGGRGGGEGGGPRVAVTSDPNTNTVYISAPAHVLETADQLIKQLDRDKLAEDLEVHVVTFEKADVTTLAATLQAMYKQIVGENAPFGAMPVIQAMPTSDSLLISSTPEQWQRVQQLMTQIKDLALPTTLPVTKIIPLKHAKAAKMAEILQQIVDPLSGAAGGAAAQAMRGMSSSQRRAFQQQQQQQQQQGQQIPVPAGPSIAIAAAEHNNSIVIVASESDQKMLADLVATLDVPASQSVEAIHMVRLEAADAVKLATTLQAMVAADQTTLSDVYVHADPLTNSVLIRAPENKRMMLEEMIATLDASTVQQARETRIVPLKHTSGAEVAATVTQMNPPLKTDDPAQAVIVAPAPGDRAVVVDAPMAKLTQIVELVGRLDVESSQALDPIHIVKLKSADATKLAATLQAMLEADEEAGKGVFVQGDAVSNVVMLRAPESKRQMLAQMVAQLDESTQANAREMRTISLQHASASAMTPMLTQLYPADRTADPSDAVIIAAAPGDKALVIDAPRAKIEQIAALVTGMDKQDSPTLQAVRTYQLTKTNAQTLAASLTKLFAPADPKATAEQGGELPPRFESDTGSNQLFVAATQSQFEKIEKAIRDIEDTAVLAVQTKTIRLQFARAAEVLPVVQAMLGDPSAQNQTTQRGGGYDDWYQPYGRWQSQENDQVAKEPPVRVAALEATNDLIVQGTVEKIALAEELIKTFDTEDAAGRTVVEIVFLRNAQAASLSEAVTAVIQARSQSGSSGFSSRRGFTQTSSTPANGDQVTVAPEPNSNSVIVRGPANQVPEIVAMIKRLDDQANPSIAQIRIYPLTESNAVEMAKTLDEMFTSIIKQQSNLGDGRTAPPFSVVANERTNSLVVSTTPAMFGLVESLLMNLDTEMERATKEAQYYLLTNADAFDVSYQLNKMYTAKPAEERPVIDYDLVANAVTVIADPAEAKTIGEIIQKIDAAAKDTSRLVRVRKMDEIKASKLAPMLKNLMEQTTVHKVRITDKLPDDARPTPQAPQPQPTNPPSNGGAGSSNNGPGSSPPPAGSPGASGDAGQPGCQAEPPSQPATPDDAAAKAIADLAAQGPLNVKTVVTDEPGEVIIAVDEATNSIIMSGTREQLDELESLIFELTAGALGGDSDFRIFDIKHSDPQSIANIINRLFNPNLQLEQQQQQLQAQFAQQQQQLMQAQQQMLQQGLLQQQLQQQNQPRGQSSRGDDEADDAQPAGRGQRPQQQQQGGGRQQQGNQLKVVVVAEPRTSRVIVRGGSADLDLVEKVIEQLDKPSTTAGAVQVFPLLNTDAAAVATNLRELLATGANQSRAVLLQSKLHREMKAAGLVQDDEPIDMGSVLSITANQPTNSIIVAAPAPAMGVIGEIIQEIDQSAAKASTPSVRMYTLQNADVQTLVPNLQQIFTALTRTQGSGSGGPPPVVITGDPASNTVIVAALPDQHALIEPVIKDIDTAQPGDSLIIEVYPVQHADATTVANTLTQTLTSGQGGQANQAIQRFLPGARTGQGPLSPAGASAALRITPDDSANVLVVRATKEQHDRIKELLEKIDVAAVTQQPVRLVALKHADAVETATLLTRLFTQGAQQQGQNIGQRRPASRTPIAIEGNRESRMLMVRADDEAFSQIKLLAEQLDVASPAGLRTQKIVRLRHAQAASVAATLSEAFGSSSANAALNGVAANGETDGSERVTIVAEPVSNSLVISANEENHAKVDALIAAIDSETTAGMVNTFLILQNVAANDLANALTRIAQNSPGAARGNVPGQMAVVSPDPSSNSLLFSGPAAEVDRLKKMAQELDMSHSMNATTGVFVIPVKNGDATAMAGIINDLFRQTALTTVLGGGRGSPNQASLAVSADVRSNSLIIATDPKNILRIQALIEQVDSVTPQRGVVRVITLRHADPADLQQAIQSIYGISSSTVPQGQGNLQRQQIPQGQFNQGQGQFNPQRGQGQFNPQGGQGQGQFNPGQFGPQNIQPGPNQGQFQINPGAGQRIGPGQGGQGQGGQRNPGAGGRGAGGGQGAGPGGANRAPGGGGGVNLDVPAEINSGDGSADGSTGPLQAPTGRVDVTPLPQQRAVLVTASDADFEAIQRLADALDAAAAGSQRRTKVALVNFVENARIATTLNQIYSAAARSGVPDDQVNVTALPGTNAVVIAAVESKIPQVEALLAELDRKENAMEMDFRVYRLEHTTPTKILPTLQQLLTRIQNTRQDENIDVLADERTRSIIVTAKGNVFDEVGKIIQTLDQAPAYAAAEVAIVQLKRADATRLAQVLTDTLQLTEGGQVTAEAQALQEQVKKLNIRSDKGQPIVLDLTQPIKITSDPVQVDQQGSNALIVSSTADNLKALTALIETMDRVPLTEGVNVRIIHLINADAQSVAQTLTDIFEQAQALAGKEGTSTEGRAEPQEPTGKAVVNPLVVSADLRTNSLVLSGREETLELAQQVVKDLDRETGKFTTDVKVFKLKHAEATRIAPMLQEVFTETATGDPGVEGLRTQVTRLRTVLEDRGQRISDIPRSRAALTIQADADTQSLIIAARSDVMPIIEDVVTLLDIPGAASGMAVRFVPLLNADGTRVKQVLDEIFRGEGAAQLREVDKPVIAVDTRTNALVVTTSDKTFLVLEALVQKLDREQPIDLRDVRIVPLKSAEATTLADTLQQMMDARVQREAALGVGDAESLRMIVMADPRSNQLIVGGSAEGFKLVEELAKQLDGAPPALGGRVQLHPLTHANAGTLSTTLTTLFNQRYESATTAEVQRQRPIILPDLRVNALLVAATEDDTTVLTGLLEKMDVKLIDPAVVLEVIAMKHNDAGVVGPSIQRLFEARLQSMTPPDTTPAPQDQVTVETDALSNALVISASRENLELIRQLLAKVDIEPASETGIVRLYALKNADATRVSTMLQSLIQQGLYKPGVAAAQDNAAITARERVAVETDLRTNTVIVSASKENFSVIEQIIKQLDSADASSLFGDIRVYLLKNADASRLAPTLQQFFDTKRQAEQDANPAAEATPQSLAVTITADARTNALLVAGSRESFAAVEQMITKLDSDQVVPASEFKVFALQQATAGVLQPMLQNLFDQRYQRGTTADPVTVIADARSNSLIVGAGLTDMAMATSLIQKLDVEPARAGLLTRVFVLEKADATSVATTLRNLYVTQADQAVEQAGISVDERTNSLVVTAGTADMNRIDELVKQLDAKALTHVTEIRVFTLDHADSTELAQLLTDTLTQKPTDPNGVDSNRQTLLQLITKTEDGQELISRALQEGVLVTSDTRTNSLVVACPLDYMPLMARLIEKLDSTSPREAEIKVFPLKNADATQMATILQQMFRLDTTATTTDTGERAVRYTLNAENGAPTSAVIGNAERYALTVTVDIRTNSLVVGGTTKYIELAGGIIQSLDASPAQERRVEIYRLRHSLAENVEAALTTFLDQERQRLETALGTEGLGAAQRLLEREVSLVAEVESNTLLVSASPRYFDTIDGMIKKLDEAKPQVLIQVALAEVMLDDGTDLGFEWNWRKGIDEANLSAGTDFGVEQAFNEFGGFGVGVTGGDLSFFLRALQSQGKVEMLSRPQILAADNRPASINVGQRVPFITQSNITDEGNTVNTIQYEDVGIGLTVTARITDDGFVHMDIAPNVSSIADSSVQISETVNAIVVNERTAETTVTVQDGHTIVIGGLITTTDMERESKVPGLGDLPLVGGLFKSTSVSKERRELLIILTPHVLRTVADVDRITNSEEQRLKLLRQMGASEAGELLTQPVRDTLKPDEPGIEVVPPTDKPGDPPSYELRVRSSGDAAPADESSPNVKIIKP